MMDFVDVPGLTDEEFSCILICFGYAGLSVTSSRAGENGGAR